jgi:hypothetical protein
VEFRSRRDDGESYVTGVGIIRESACRLKSVTLDTDTTVHTLFGQQMGARKGYNPQHRGKKSYQPMLTFLAETR